MHIALPLSRARAAQIRALGLALVAINLAACGAVATPMLVPAPATPAPLAVTSTIVDGALLTTPLRWIATVTGASSADPIDHVDFVLDGAVAWTEHTAPYQFNDDGDFLVPAVLTPGRHRLTIHAVTVSGAGATTAATVTTTRPRVPAMLAGRAFERRMPAGPGMPAGDWRIRFEANGVILVQDANGGGVTEAFVATSDGGLELYGPTTWLTAPAVRHGFCNGADGVQQMRWHVSGADLTLSSIGGLSGGRPFVCAGTWRAVA